MWRLVFFLAGWCRIRITGASPQWILSALATRRVAFREFRKTDDFTAELRILKRDLPAAYAAAQRSMCDLELMQCGGFAATFAWVKKRPLFPLLLTLTILTGTTLPRFVWFYEVTGNERVPAQKILRELDALGVGFGTYGKSIQPQWVKNHMLFRIPELQWLTVTQNGACATVVVRERPEAEPVDDRKTARNVVAARAGLVTRVSVLAGSSLCKPGDVVREGPRMPTSAIKRRSAARWRRSTRKHGTGPARCCRRRRSASSTPERRAAASVSCSGEKDGSFSGTADFLRETVIK